jgi:predicted Zn-dependent protease
MLLLLLEACATVPYTERSQFIMVSEGEELALGARAFDEVKKTSTLSTDPALNAMIERVGRRIAEASAIGGYEWEFILIDDEAVNAFALPGGKVAFYTGILPFCEDEAGVAVVMGHEIAHVIARHGAERMSQGRALAFGQALLSIALSSSAPVTREVVSSAYGIGAKVGVILPFSRSHESEADEIGVTLMARAGYDPATAVRFWTRMAKNGEGKKRLELLSTHPGDEDRIEKLNALLAEAEIEYQKSMAEHPEYKRAPERIVMPSQSLKKVRKP